MQLQTVPVHCDGGKQGLLLLCEKRRAWEITNKYLSN